MLKYVGLWFFFGFVKGFEGGGGSRISDNRNDDGSATQIGRSACWSVRPKNSSNAAFYQ